MAGLDEPRRLVLVSGLAKRGEHAVDSIAWVSKEAIDTPLSQSINNELTGGMWHVGVLIRVSQRKDARDVPAT
jgi:hypothetical protein